MEQSAQPNPRVQKLVKGAETEWQHVLKQQELQVHQQAALPPPASFARSQNQLETALGRYPYAADKVALQNALADLHFAWGQYWWRYAKYSAYSTPQGEGFNWDQARSHFWRAYSNDKVRRPQKAFDDQAQLAQVSSRDDPKTGNTSIWILQSVIAHYRKTQNWVALADALRFIGEVYRGLGRVDDARRHYDQALSIYQRLPNRLSETGWTWFGIAALHDSKGEYEDELNALQKARHLFQAAHDTEGIIATLDNTGWLYLIQLERPQEALDWFAKDAKLCKRYPNDFRFQGLARNCASGVAYSQVKLKNYAKGMRLSRELLAFARKANDPWIEAGSLHAIGDIYLRTKRYAEAAQYCQMAAPRFRRIELPENEGEALHRVGYCYMKLGRFAEALRFLNRALQLNRAAQNVVDETDTVGVLCALYARQKQRQTAIVFGKQAVNLIQSVRRTNQRLAPDAQRGILEHSRETYELLASLLVQDNRLEEAEQVLRFLRQQDAFEFVQRDPALTHDLAGLFQPLAYTPVEKQQLLLKTSAAVEVVSQGVTEGQLWQEALAQREAKGAGRAALISTFNTEEAFYVILTTAKKRLAFSVPFKRESFDALAQKLRSELSDPRIDPRPEAQKMENIVFCWGQLDKALQAEGITTALWFTSGPLRSIPIDALYDGSQYLVQKPRLNVNVTLTSRHLFGDVKQGETLAAGVSKPHTLTLPLWGRTSFSALVNVPKEVRSIVNDVAQGGTGPFHGRILLDRSFNAASLEKDLSTGPAIVHIATHFSLAPSGGDDSFLLMGDGKPLRISQWKRTLNLRGVDLLALSGCDTGVSRADSSGGEVSSLGEVSQWLGAQSVLVSLWPVADTSTADLMGDFYSRWHANPEKGKAQALREAQCALLGVQSTTADVATTGAAATRGPVRERVAGSSEFVADPAHPFAHPFYWAPFTLIGNWQ